MTEELGVFQTMGLQRGGHDLVTTQQQQAAFSLRNKEQLIHTSDRNWFWGNTHLSPQHAILWDGEV